MTQKVIKPVFRGCEAGTDVHALNCELCMGLTVVCHLTEINIDQLLLLRTEISLPQTTVT